ncbi:MAG: phosphatidylserine decarboxylase [Candidatus Korobacteraceae bacterium]|jgi:phosphatidylserine decarboxylase
MQHQYIERNTGNVVREQLLADSLINALYSPALERAPLLSRMASSRYVSQVLGYLNYDNLVSSRATGMLRFLRQSGIPLSEFVGNLSDYDTARKIFERQIRYWNCRPMPQTPRPVLCPADARALIGSMEQTSGLYLKQKFFSFPELLGEASAWHSSFQNGDYAVFRLTPEKYHYTHSPVSGRVLDIYSVEGRYYSCNPNAAVQVITPFSKNRRVITILDSDCPNGSRVGRVAMIEVVALMVGQIEQRYSEHRYENPRPVEKAMFLKAGAPKALFRPGSSTVVLLFQAGRISFAPDLAENQRRSGVQNRFALTLGEPVTETDVAVRSLLATPAEEEPC